MRQFLVSVKLVFSFYAAIALKLYNIHFSCQASFLLLDYEHLL